MITEKSKRKLWLLSVFVAFALLVQGASADTSGHLVRNDTQTITSYASQGAITKSVSVEYAGSIPDPFTFLLNFYNPIWGIGVDWNGVSGSQCVVKINNDIYCTGSIVWISVAWSYSYLPQTLGATMIDQLRAGGGTDKDYTMDIFYPPYLTFTDAEYAPTFQEPGHIQWSIADMHLFESWVSYHDTRIKALFIPLVLR